MEKKNFLYDKDYFYSYFKECLEDSNKYKLIAEYWKEAIFKTNNLDTDASILDYGCGIGLITGALKNVTYFDVSEFPLNFLKERGRNVIFAKNGIPANRFDYVLSCHSLEHTPDPAGLLRDFLGYVKKEGKLILIIPIENEQNRRPIPTIDPDYKNMHLYCWTFQTITNLLVNSGWKPVYQDRLCGPYLLRTLARIIPMEKAVKIAHASGKLVNSYPSIITIAEVSS